MIRVKRLYRYMLRSYVPLLLMTFFICLFIVLMQFLWRYIDDLVGKGLSIDVIGELFFYAALTMVPMALPLAILLASLMIFGNLGEKFELTAMKASGISLLKVMSPLIILISFIAVGAFFFQNNVLPVAQTKMWTLLYSMRQKSPELEIPEGVFYTQIPGYNFYVESKDRDSGTLFNLMIYDVSRGFDNARVILADSGHLKSADDKAHLFLQLYNGEQFENLRESGAYSQSSQPYRSENFDLKEILLAFDANFTRMDEAGMRNQYVGKNMTQLQATIDSVGLRVDSIGAVYAKEIKERPYINVTPVSTVRSLNGKAQQEVRIPYPAASVKSYNIDSLFYADLHRTRNYLTGAIRRVQTIKQEYEFRSFVMEEDRATIRRHGIEMHRKFTLSFACLVFFFIGAPLGAIIRKGGIGTPLVISVLLFIFYYIIDNTGFKFARDGKTAVWEGVWLSSFVLLPLGVFLTYKAMRDSAVLNGDAYKNFFRRLRGLQRRELELKQYAMVDVTPARAMASLQPMLDACNEVKEQWDALPFYRKTFYTIWRFKPFDMLAERMNSLIDFLANSKNPHTIQLINNYPYKVSRRTLPVITETTRSLIDLCNNLSKNE
ncbi:MAG: LptF/LptG family permease [Muribaculaceae bacterium]|nr:LptF/LptG family permease [Muribaculaceae bacterium]